MAERIYPPEVPKLAGQKWPDVAPYLEEFLRRLQFSNDDTQDVLDVIEEEVATASENDHGFQPRPPRPHTHTVYDVFGSAILKRVELDFGATAVRGKVFVVADGSVTPSSKIIMVQSGAAATGKQADEAEFDAIDCRCEPLAGSFRVYARSLLGHIRGPFKFDYAVA